MKILNTWTSTKDIVKFYNESNLVYTNGDYRIFKQFDKSFIYTYKNVAINNLCGLNKPHLDSLVEERRPKGKYSPDHFLYDRAIESKIKGLRLEKELNIKSYEN